MWDSRRFPIVRGDVHPLGGTCFYIPDPPPTHFPALQTEAVEAPMVSLAVGGKIG